MENTRLACAAYGGGRKSNLTLPTTRHSHHTLLLILNKANPRISTNLPAVGLQLGSAVTDLYFSSVRIMLLQLLLYIRYFLNIAAIVVFIVYACIMLQLSLLTTTTTMVAVSCYYCRVFTGKILYFDLLVLKLTCSTRLPSV